MIPKLRRVLSYQLTIAELIGIGLLLGTPYLIVGLIWSATHTEHLTRMTSADLVVSFLGSIASWPVLLFSNVCMTGFLAASFGLQPGVRAISSVAGHSPTLEVVGLGRRCIA
jgi:hypothetical protein